MITIVVAALLGGAGADPADTYIHSFVQCLHDADSNARSQKIAPDTYSGFARQHCSSPQESYHAALVTEDEKHGMSHKEAVSDAASVIDSYYSERSDNYQAFYKRMQPVADDKAPVPAPKVTPPVTPAAQPK
jgi:hypothetical protein